MITVFGEVMAVINIIPNPTFTCQCPTPKSIPLYIDQLNYTTSFLATERKVNYL